MTKRKLVYILSPSYSGSTLLTMLMNVHPSISTIGELKATSMEPISDYMCSCGTNINECAFWDEIQAVLAGKNATLDLADYGTHFKSDKYIFDRILRAQVRGPLFEGLRKTIIDAVPALKSEYQAILNKNELMVNAICENQGGDYFLDGSKDPNRLLFMDRSGRWDIYVIYMIRDGRAQSNSARSKEDDKFDFYGAVNEWKSTVLQMNEACVQMTTQNVHHIKYEDLCESPSVEMNKIWSFLGLEEIEQDWSKVTISQKDQHIIGNNMRKKDNITIRLDQRWNEKVTTEELEYFDNQAGSLHAELGYQRTKR